MKTPEEILDKYHHHLFYRDYVLELFKEYADQFKHPEVTDDEIKEYFTTQHFDNKNGHHYRINKDRVIGAKAMRDGKIGGEK